MSPEAQRIAIAEACGWNSLGWDESTRAQTWWIKMPREVIPRLSYQEIDRLKTWQLPDYLNDLNACREAVEYLAAQNPLFKLTYLLELQKIVCPGSFPGMDVFPMVEAAPAQKSEAILKALGKWTPTEATEEGKS